ncbi:acetolactate synthase-1/2/3 large subunit [Pseudomonas peli]|uniref:Acetolactate synthase-1/2/3 large subunit n=1 Tax=Pseudomonas peli TaxID=592361 RepID=A0AB37Z3B7_9PSED|nr:thiamine pyrophosphate-binding protein [Pseudomonas peli]NMZ69176.1 thiamine pyrophosphate-binding protein [Pseudomonas peli]SCW34098.1 acetolactate synthase-1/2/3 large subunit [Pseudomonas peli]
MKTISEQIADWLATQSIEQVFAVTGGGAMFLNQALASHPRLKCTFMHHEQACAMAAEGYARITGKPAVVNVTTGPGGINALNGVFGAFTDSIPMLVISGQVKRETSLDHRPLPGLRQLGDQEAPITAMAMPVCKSALAIGSVQELGEALPKLLHLACEGRPGPVWIDIPLDLQGSKELIEFVPCPASEDISSRSLSLDCDKVVQQLLAANRPLILAGTGVRLSGAEQALLAFVEHHQIPLATAWTHDLIASDHPLFAGRPGTIGTRAGNFTLQNADLVIVLGSRLNIRQTSYNWDAFACRAFKIHVDIDPAELNKPTLQTDVRIEADIKVFLSELQAALDLHQLPDFSPWVHWLKTLPGRFPLRRIDHCAGQKLNPYAFVEYVFERLRVDDIIVCGNASACILPFQVGHLQAGQRMFSNSGSASMGYDLPAALGAALAAPSRRVICFAGDGSLQMNVQELQTLCTLGPNVVIVVLDNQGYLSIRQTHENFFGHVVGATPQSGVDCPDYVHLAEAYGIAAYRLNDVDDIPLLEAILEGDGPMLLHVLVNPEQEFEPRLKSRMDEDGKFQTPELDDMYPFLDIEQVRAVRAEAAAINAVRR